jgi:hypothetical protein
LERGERGEIGAREREGSARERGEGERREKDVVRARDCRKRFKC